MALILRNVKGTPLTFTEGDNNLTYLESLTGGYVFVTSPVIVWNMDTSPFSPLYAHGLSATEWLTVRNITTQVQVGTGIWTVSGDDNFTQVTATDFQVNRKTAGTFDLPLFNAANLTITFMYKAD